MTSLRRAAFAAAFLLPSLAGAAELDGSKLSPVWGLPFAGILLSIALCLNVSIVHRRARADCVKPNQNAARRAIGRE